MTLKIDPTLRHDTQTEPASQTKLYDRTKLITRGTFDSILANPIISLATTLLSSSAEDIEFVPSLVGESVNVTGPIIPGNAQYEAEVRTFGLSPSKPDRQVIGQGISGVVLESSDRNQVGKFISPWKTKNPRIMKQIIKNEQDILQTLTREDAPHVTQLKAVCATENFDRVAYIMSHAGVDLFNKYIDSRNKNYQGNIDFETIQRIAYQTLLGLSHMHSKDKGRPPIMHGDIKLGNIAEDEDKNVKIIDLGYACFLPNGTTNGTRFSLSTVPPEQLLRISYGTAADIWCFGITLFELATKNLFMTDKIAENFELSVLYSLLDRLGIDSVFFEKIKETRKDFFDEQGNLKPRSKRKNLPRFDQTLKQMMVHPKVDLLIDLISQTLRYNPDERITAEDLLSHPFFEGVSLPEEPIRERKMQSSKRLKLEF